LPAVVAFAIYIPIRLPIKNRFADISTKQQQSIFAFAFFISMYFVIIIALANQMLKSLGE
jgi:hypothetical protein